MKLFARFTISAAAALLTACSTMPEPQTASAAQLEALESIRAKYQEGDYAEVAREVGMSLELQTLPADLHAEALKLQSFSYCLLEDSTRCARSFTRLLQRYPSFELSPAEKQHPMWGPVYEQVQTQANTQS